MVSSDDINLDESATLGPAGTRFSDDYAYTDNLATFSQNAIKGPVVAATTENISLSGTQTIDGVAVVAGDRVLVKDQTTGSENGIYEVAAGLWSRVLDFDDSTDVVTGTRVLVINGGYNGGHEFYVSTTGTITPGTTSIAFTDLSSVVVSGEPTILLTGSGTIPARSTTFVVRRVAPTATSISLPSVSDQSGIILRIADWSSDVTEHTITLTPDGADTIMLQSAWGLVSTAYSLAGVTLVPSISLGGWIIAP